MKVGTIACLAQHRSGIAANEMGPPSLETVMVIQIKVMGSLRKSSVIVGHLTVIFTEVFEI
jgi:hypothetical protein